MNYHKQFMNLALSEAEKALSDGDFPVGCVFVLDGQVVAKGRRKNSKGPQANEIDHAEVTTLRTMLRIEPLPDLSRIIAYSTLEPCLMCFSTLLLSGIRNFVWAYEDVMGGGTNVPLEQLNPLYAGLKISMTSKIQRQESLRLFQQFFQKHAYWQDSFLSRYTLEQPMENKS